MNYAEQIAELIASSARQDPKVLVLGAGVTDPKGIFGTTSRVAVRSPKQVIETPLSEMMLTGALVGLAQTGYRPIFVHARADFMTFSAEHLVNTIAKWKYMGGGDLPIMIRCIIGQGWGNGPQHTQSFAHWFASVPGLNVYTPHSRQGITEAFDCWRSGNPTVVFEHRALYATDLLPDDWRNINPDILLFGVSGVMPQVFQAQKLLKRVNVMANVMGVENWVGVLNIEGDMPAVLVDIAPRAPTMRSIFGGRRTYVSPPNYPCPASYPLEAAWYPSPERIANAALRLIGRSEQFTDNAMHVAAPTGGGPF